MGVKINEVLANAANFGGSRGAGEIRYLVIHYTGNDGDTAAANATYYKNTVVGASAHYFVDDSGVYRSVPELRTAWAVGGKKWAELRKLHMLSEDGAMSLHATGIPVISSEKEWESFFYRTAIGFTHKVIVSENCLNTCAPYTLYHYAVHRRALRSDKLPPDVILLGDYKNVPDVFLIR